MEGYYSDTGLVIRSRVATLIFLSLRCSPGYGEPFARNRFKPMMQSTTSSDVFTDLCNSQFGLHSPHGGSYYLHD